MKPSAADIVARYEDPPASLRAYLHVRWRICPFERVLATIPEQGRLLDVGCGSGLWLTYLALERPGLDLEGLDPDPRKLALAARSRAGAPELREGTAQDLPEGRFDCVTILDVLYLMPDEVKAAVIAGCARALVPGGLLVAKELDTRPRWKFAPAALEELVAVRVVGMTHGERSHFQPVEALADMVREAGLEEVEAARIDAGYLHPHVMVTGRKPASGG